VEALGLAGDELAVLCVLMLRGPQTPGELNQRTGRLHPFTGLAAIHETLDRLAERDLIERLPRRPGQKEERYRHLLGGDEAAPRAETRAETRATDADLHAASPVGAPSAPPGLEARVAELEAQVAQLRETLDRLESGGAARA
jgi:uncharacterized protein YceH (UPF0502 family)